MPRGEPRRHRALGLRRRGTIAFAALALLVSASMAILTYQIARTYLVDKRESLALRQAALNARAVQEVLRARDPDVQDLMAGLPTSSTSHPVLRIGGEWYAAAVSFGQDIVPSALLQMTEDDRAGRQLTTANGEPVLVVGVPIAGTDAVYFEAFSLTELERTLATLRNSLLIAAAITTVIGAFLGSYLNRRALKPLRTFAEGAAGLARGRLETRLAAPGDPDLAPVAAAFNDMAAALQDRIEREARFASDVTHELRTPLTALSAAVEVLDRRADERMRPAVDVVQAQVQHFERLVLDLLEISRYDAGAAELTTEAVDVARFFHSLTDSLDTEGVSLVIDPSTPKTFDLDKRRVERALANLLENAHRYADGPIAITVAGNDDRLRITVDDCGPGIVPEERAAIFERFHRSVATATDGTRGTGLGLALVAEHAALHGGRAWVESAPSGGARFVVELAQRCES